MDFPYDDKDLKILEMLLEDGRVTKAGIGRSVGLAPSAVSERIKQLKSDGVLKTIDARIDPEKLGFELLVFIFVGEVKPSKGFDLGEALANVTGVEEVHRIAGEDCFLVKLRTKNTKALSEILKKEINQIQNVARVHSTVVLQTIKEKAPLKGRSLS